MAFFLAGGMALFLLITELTVIAQFPPSSISLNPALSRVTAIVVVEFLGTLGMIICCVSYTDTIRDMMGMLLKYLYDIFCMLGV